MKDRTAPLVSVVIPAYNRPHYLEQAIQSVLGQTYTNIEIIICDDSTNDQVESMLLPYLDKYPQIKYFKNEKNLFLDNWQRCYELAEGEYINYLMDDDLFHPKKIEKMMSYYLENNSVRLVTSCRQLIDEHGGFLPPIKATVRLFGLTTTLDGIWLGNYVLSKCLNVIGEGTTVLFRKGDLAERFGTYKGKQYCCLNDVATWLPLLAKGKAVYIPEALSYFRIHPNQNNSSDAIVSTAVHEWLDLMVDSREDGFLQSPLMFKKALLKYYGNLQGLRHSKKPALRRKVQEVLQRIESIAKIKS